MLDAIEEFKRSVGRENINAGLAAAKRRGVKLGRPQTVNRRAVKRLRARALSGWAISKELGIPNSSVFGILDNCPRAEDNSLHWSEDHIIW